MPCCLQNSRGYPPAKDQKSESYDEELSVLVPKSSLFGGILFDVSVWGIDQSPFLIVRSPLDGLQVLSIGGGGHWVDDLGHEGTGEGQSLFSFSSY